MKANLSCEECQRELVALIDGALTPSVARVVEGRAVLTRVVRGDRPDRRHEGDVAGSAAATCAGEMREAEAADPRRIVGVAAGCGGARIGE